MFWRMINFRVSSSKWNTNQKKRLNPFHFHCVYGFLQQPILLLVYIKVDLFNLILLLSYHIYIEKMASSSWRTTPDLRVWFFFSLYTMYSVIKRECKDFVVKSPPHNMEPAQQFPINIRVRYFPCTTTIACMHANASSSFTTQ